MVYLNFIQEKGKVHELIAAIIDVLGKRGVRSVVAWVSEANIGSSKILLKNGFIKSLKVNIGNFL